QGRIPEDPTLHILHYKERAPDDLRVLTEHQALRNRDAGVSERPHDAELPLDRRRGGQQVARRLAPQNELPIANIDEIGRDRLPTFELGNPDDAADSA